MLLNSNVLHRTIWLKRKMKFGSHIFANRSYQGPGCRLGKWQSNRQRAKKLGIGIHPAPQSATCWMQFLGWAKKLAQDLATYFSPCARWGIPCVKNTARTKKWKEFHMGMLERRKFNSKPLLLDSVCWYLGSLLSLLLMSSGIGLVPHLKGQHGDKLSSLWSPWC